MTPTGLAAAAYPIERLAEWPALEAKLTAWITAAQDDGAAILALPEYAGVEAALIGDTDPRSAADWCTHAATKAADYAALCAGLAKRHGVWLLSGSMPAPAHGDLVNRAWLCGPDGRQAVVDKQVLTPWERTNTPLVPGHAPRAFDTDLGRIAVLICYDAEFPAFAAALSPDILLVPACTDSLAGQTRVRVAARARALELQCLVLHAPLVGPVNGVDLVDENIGRAAIFAPPDSPFPETGILAETAPNAPGWATAPFKPEDLAATRQDGAVAPRAHAAEAGARAGAVTVSPWAEEEP